LHDKTNPFLYIYCISQVSDTRKHRFRAGYNQAEDRSNCQNLWEFHSIRMWLIFQRLVAMELDKGIRWLCGLKQLYNGHAQW